MRTQLGNGYSVQYRQLHHPEVPVEWQGFAGVGDWVCCVFNRDGKAVDRMRLEHPGRPFKEQTHIFAKSCLSEIVADFPDLDTLEWR
jgi:hypothetical protein